MINSYGQHDDFKYLSDEELIIKYRDSSDNFLIGILFKRYSHLVYGVCRYYLSGNDRASDAVMEIFAKLYELLKKHHVSNFKSWLCTVSKNYCLMQLRKSSERMLVFTDEIYLLNNRIVENPTLGHPDIHDYEQQIENLLEIVSQLKETQQRCIRMFYLESYSYEEIAWITGLSYNEIKSNIQNGKRNLKLMLEGKKESYYE